LSKYALTKREKYEEVGIDRGSRNRIWLWGSCRITGQKTEIQEKAKSEEGNPGSSATGQSLHKNGFEPRIRCERQTFNLTGEKNLEQLGKATKTGESEEICRRGRSDGVGKRMEGAGGIDRVIGREKGTRAIDREGVKSKKLLTESRGEKGHSELAKWGVHNCAPEAGRPD